MKRFMTSTLTALALLLSPSAGQDLYADDCECFITEGIYLGGYGGATWYRDYFLSTDIDDDGVMGQFKPDLGYSFGAFIGYRCCNGFRFEFDFGYRHSEYDQLTVFHSDNSGITATEVPHSDMDTTSFMFNIIKECGIIFCDYFIRPYFGGGIGVANVEFDLYSDVDSVVITHKADSTEMAFQLIFGFNYPYTDCLDFGLEYRLFGVDTPELQNDAGTPSAFLTARSWIFNHSMMVNVKSTIGSFW